MWREGENCGVCEDRTAFEKLRDKFSINFMENDFLSMYFVGKFACELINELEMMMIHVSVCTYNVCVTENTYLQLFQLSLQSSH